MPAAPTLHIGMPVYNGAKWIQESIEYLLNQSFRDFELIIADNASTDEHRDDLSRDRRTRSSSPVPSPQLEYRRLSQLRLRVPALDCAVFQVGVVQ